MSEQAVVQTAKMVGIYRCSGLGETKYCQIDEELPQCSCDGGGDWGFYKGDNIRSEDAIAVLIGRGAIHAIETDELPEVGSHLNIRRGMVLLGLETGKHRITLVEPDFQWRGKSEIRIQVERVGDLADDLPIHHTVVLNV